MEPFQAIAILITLAAVFAYINHLFIRIPMTIGLMLLSLVISIMLILIDKLLGIPISQYANQLVRSIDFSKVLLDGMLGLLLFAGALHVDFNDLAEQKIRICIFATVGVVASTFLTGIAVYEVSRWINLNLRLIDALLFGALISPTDPIAVLSILKKTGVPKSLETKIAGESLFNDGVGVVIFLAILEIAVSGNEITAGPIVILFFKEVVGGVLLGLTAGYVAYRMLKSLNHYQVEVMITLSLVIGGYALATALHLSAPIAIVMAGLLIGNHGRAFAMSDVTREHLDTFWELIDEILNAVLFVLIGLEVLVLTLKGPYFLAGVIAVPITLFARFLSIAIPVCIMRRWQKFTPGAVRIMTWGGLRGGISVALALALPGACQRELILTMTYIVVVFSIVIQGLTIQMMVKKTS